MYNTIIIGAGPIGSYLAGKLTQLGYKVIVLEKKASAGQNICCTGIISKECYDLLPLDINLVTRQANSAKFFVPSGRYLRLCRNDDVAYTIDRMELETALANHAQAIGTEYLFSTQVTNIEYGTNCLRVIANGYGRSSVFEAETAIIATGYGSNLPKSLNLGKITDFTIGAQAEVAINGTDEVEIYLDHNLAPGSFGWLVPTREGKGLAGLMTRHQHAQHLNQLLLKLKIHGKIASTEVTNNYGAIPLRSLPKTFTDRILVVGEAAGQTKPTTGGGIYYGILCANIAANVLNQAFTTGNFSAAKLSSYQKQWRHMLSRDLTIGYWAQRLWAKLSNNHIEYLINIAERKDIPELINTTDDFSFDWHGKLIFHTARSLIPFTKLKKQL